MVVLHAVIPALKTEVNRLTGKKLKKANVSVTLKASCVVAATLHRPVGLREQKLSSGVSVGTCTSLVSWRAADPEHTIQCDPSSFTGSSARSPSLTSPCCTTYKMPRHVALSGRSSSWCLLLPSCHRMGFSHTVAHPFRLHYKQVNLIIPRQCHLLLSGLCMLKCCASSSW